MASVSYMVHMFVKYLVKQSHVGRIGGLVTLFVNTPKKRSVCVFLGHASRIITSKGAGGGKLHV
jgi:hypothetical protein